MLKKIVSGGQTGVDRGALDAALESGFPCGGWCPQGRMAEDGAIDDRYPLAELAGAGYRERTRQNVLDSDGTVVICFGQLSGGTLETVRLCERLGKPVLVCDAAKQSPDAIAADVWSFTETENIAQLNIAGPRESGHSGARESAAKVVSALIRIGTEHATPTGKP